MSFLAMLKLLPDTHVNLVISPRHVNLKYANIFLGSLLPSQDLSRMSESRLGDLSTELNLNPNPFLSVLREMNEKKIENPLRIILAPSSEKIRGIVSCLKVCGQSIRGMSLSGHD